MYKRAKYDTSTKAKIRKALMGIHNPEVATRPLSMAVHRIMSIITTDLHNHDLLFDKQAQRKDPLRTLTDEEVEALRALASDLNPASPAKPSKAVTVVESKSSPRLGSRDVHRLARLDPGGMFWRYACLAPYGYFPPRDVVVMMIWSLSTSPLLFWGIDKIMCQLQDQKKFGKRTLTLIDSPYAQL